VGAKTIVGSARFCKRRRSDRQTGGTLQVPSKLADCIGIACGFFKRCAIGKRDNTCHQGARDSWRLCNSRTVSSGARQRVGGGVAPTKIPTQTRLSIDQPVAATASPIPRCKLSGPLRGLRHLQKQLIAVVAEAARG